MKIKRFFAADARQAMKQVKEVLGEDAVILSNKRVNGGVELIAAIDYEEEAFAAAEPVSPPPTPTSGQARQQQAAPVQPALVQSTPPRSSQVHQNQVQPEQLQPEPPRAAEPRQPAAAAQQAAPNIIWSQEPTLVEMRSEIQNMRGLLENQLRNLTTKDFRASHPFQYELKQRLAQLGVGAALANDLIKHLPQEASIEELWRRLLAKLAVSLPVTEDDILVNGGVVALVGPTGVGKTTTVAKLAARYALRHGSRDVALISTDNYRIGAHEQIKAYARILGVPYRFANSADALQNALDLFCDRRLVLIDTAGMSQKDLRLAQELALLRNSSEAVRAYLVMTATSRLSGLDEVVRSFSHIELKGAILTKVDEATSLGHALDVAIRHRLPLAYISDGQRVPEDLQPARGQTLINQCVAMMQENSALLDNEITGAGLGEVYS